MDAFCLRKILLAFALSPFVNGQALAQSTYSLSQLVDSATPHYPELRRKSAQLEAAQAVVTDTRNLYLPSLKLNEQVNLSTDNSLAGSYLSFGMIPSTSAGVRAENNVEATTGNIGILQSQYDLVDFGYRSAQVNRARAYVHLQEADLQQEEYYLKLQVARWYFLLLKSQRKLQANAENIRRYESIFNVIKALTASGIRAGSDSSLALAELSRTKIVYNQNREQAENCKIQLSWLTGIPANRVTADTAALKDKSSAINFLGNVIDSLHHPVIGYYKELKNIAIANEQLIAKSFLPKIVLTAAGWARGSSIAFNDQFKSLGNGLGFQRFNYLAGFSFQYDLFNGIRKRARVKAYQFDILANDLALQGQQLRLQTAAQQANNAIQTTENNLTELPVQLSAAQDTYNQKVAQYKAGIINVVDLTNAAYVLYRSMNDYAETLGDWYLAQLDKAVATGNLDSFIQAIK
ncbi:MAG TPA: TolC family protein [Chitinophagaceae bacterium]|nr:TolC family protein [Chitinophagaceae bacterium]